MPFENLDEMIAALAVTTQIVSAGNPVVAIERLAQSLAKSPAGLIGAAPAELATILATCRDLHQPEATLIEAALRAVPGSPPDCWDSAVAVLRTRLTSAIVGRAWVVTDLKHQGIGGLHPLDIEGTLGASHEHPLIKSDIKCREAFELGIHQAKNYLHQRGVGTLSSSLILNRYGFRGLFPPGSFPDGLGGDSLGLPVALAVLSAVLQRPTRSGFVATGSLGYWVDGRVHKVKGLANKFEVASRAGLTLIYPSENAGEFAPGVHARPVWSLAEAVAIVFDEEAIRLGVATLQNYFRDNVNSFPERGVEEPRQGGVLISAVGSNDPRSGGGVSGALVAIAEKYRPSRALLLHTHDDESVDRAAKSKAALEELECLVELGRVHADDPTDFRVLFFEFSKHVSAFRRTIDRISETSVITNVSSGTPQMQMTMHLLVERGVLPDTRLQVVEPRFDRGGGRVKPVTLPTI